MNRWALTMRYTNLKKRDPTEDLYNDRLAKIAKMGCIPSKITFENTKGLHIHGVIETPNGFNMKLLRCRGWQTVLKDLFDEDEWDAYLNKERVDCPSDDEDDGICSKIIKKLKRPLWVTDKDMQDFSRYKLTINHY